MKKINYPEVVDEYLSKMGYTIIDRNVRPSVGLGFKKSVIDVVAYDGHADTMAFVVVKHHSRPLKYDVRIRGLDKAKMASVHLAARQWMRRNRWEGQSRFDIMEAYGTPGNMTIDHLEGVHVFYSGRRKGGWK